MSKDTTESQHAIGFLRRKPTVGAPALQRRSRNRKMASERLQWLIDLISQCFDLLKRKSLRDMLNRLSRRKLSPQERRFICVRTTSAFAHPSCRVLLIAPFVYFLLRRFHLRVFN